MGGDLVSVQAKLSDASLFKAKHPAKGYVKHNLPIPAVSFLSTLFVSGSKIPARLVFNTYVLCQNDGHETITCSAWKQPFDLAFLVSCASDRHTRFSEGVTEGQIAQG